MFSANIKRLTVFIVIISMAFLGVLSVSGMSTGMGHQMSAMTESQSCGSSVCSAAPITATGVGTCVGHCLNELAAIQTAIPLLIFFGLALVIVFLQRELIDHFSGSVGLFSDAIFKRIQHAKLATVVLRN